MTILQFRRTPEPAAPTLTEQQLAEIRQAEIDTAVRHRYRHVLAELDATLAELTSLEANGYTLTSTEIRHRLTRIRTGLVPPATPKAKV